MARRMQNATMIQPVKSDGTLAAVGSDATFDPSNGVYTLTAGATYYVEIPCADAPWFSLQTQGDAAIILTSVTLESTNLAPHECALTDDNAGQWLAIDAGRIISTAEGTGWTATSDVIAASGGNAGGAVQNVTDEASRRARAKIVVGGTGGEARFTAWAKE